MTEDLTPSRVVPLLVAALVCDSAVVDPTTGKKSLIGVFDTIHIGKFPTQRPISLYFKVADAEGYYKLEVRYIRVGTGEILAQAEGEMMATDRLTSTDLHHPFPPLPIPAEDRYEFQIWANSMYLGSTSVRAVQRGV